MALLYPILFVGLFKQSSYKNTILLSVIHKQLTYFSKKYSKLTKVTLSKTNKLSTLCDNDNIKAIKYVHKKINIINYNKLVFRCAKLGNIKIMRYCLSCKYDIETIILVNDNHYSDLLSFICMYNHLKLVKLLLNKIVNVNILADAFQISLDYGHIMIVKFMLNNGVVNIHYYDYYALYTSIKNGYDKMIKLWLDKGININKLVPEYHDLPVVNCSMLWISIKRGDHKITKLLLDAGANIRGHHEDLLYESAKKGFTKIVKLLLTYGADVHEEDDSALRISAKYGHLKTVELLLENGANVHANNNEALLWSARNGHSKIVKLLLNKGANIRVVDVHEVPPKIKKIKLF